MSDSTIAWDVAKHLVSLVRDTPEATGVLVEPGWPGDQNTKPEMLWIDDISEGTTEVPVMTGGRMHRDFFFTITFLSRVTGRTDLDSTMTRVAQLGALLENPIADTPTLDDFTSVVSADFVTTGLTCGRTPQGCVGFGRHEARIHARLT